MKRTKFLALLLIAVLLVGSTLGVSANPTPNVSLLDHGTGWVMQAPDLVGDALLPGISVTPSANNIVVQGEWADAGRSHWSGPTLATPVEFPVSQIDNINVVFNVNIEENTAAAPARVHLGLRVAFQVPDGTADAVDGWLTRNFFRAHGTYEPLAAGTRSGTNTLGALLGMGFDNMPSAADVALMRETNGNFRILAFAVITDTTATINEFRVIGTGGGNNQPAPSPSPGAGTGSPPPSGNPKTFDATSPYALFLGGALLLTAGMIFAPKLLKKEDK